MLLNIGIFDEYGYILLLYSFKLGIGCDVILFSVWHETVHLLEYKFMLLLCSMKKKKKNK